jgi:hypothetical protein
MNGWVDKHQFDFCLFAKPASSPGLPNCLRDRRSAWRPVQLAAGKEMEVEMVDQLSPMSATIDDHAIAAVKVEIAGQIANHEPQVGQQFGILVCDGI